MIGRGTIQFEKKTPADFVSKIEPGLLVVLRLYILMLRMACQATKCTL